MLGKSTVVIKNSRLIGIVVEMSCLAINSYRPGFLFMEHRQTV